MFKHLHSSTVYITPGDAGWSWWRFGCHKDPRQTEFQFCCVPRMGGIKLQLLCGVRIELAVGSLPYLAWYLSRSLPHTQWGQLRVPSEVEGCYKHANPLGLSLNPVRGAFHNWIKDLGPNQSNKQTIIKLWH